MQDVGVEQILQQIRALSKEAGFAPSAADEPTGQALNFSKVLRDSIDQVNELQHNAGDLAAAFERGDPNVHLSQVMIEMQKARVSFEAISQVRNKLITAYQEIMNMQV